MGFPVALSDNQLDYLAGREFAGDVYLLVWGGVNIEKQIVMKARINQTFVAGSFSELIFDQTDSAFDKGAYTDAIEGYTIFLSETTNIRDNYWSGRLRKNTTATTLFVELTERTFSNNDYIFILKDVRPGLKHPLEVAGVQKIDVDKPYQAPPEAISGLETAYLGKLGSDGKVQISFSPTTTPIASGATHASDLWTIDGGTIVVGSVSTQAITIEYDTPGFYLPRYKTTDSNGNTQWFTPHVVIDDANMSSAVNLSVLGGSFNHRIGEGATGSIPFFAGVENVLDYTFVAVYVDEAYGNSGGSNIIFAGHMRRETDSHEFDLQAANTNTVEFQVQSIGAQLAEQRNFSWLFQDKASPTTFFELKDATVWRVIASYLLFMTNVNNIFSLSFQDTSNDYLFREFPVEQSYILTALENIMFTINATFDFSLGGAMKLVRNANYMDSTDRNALPTIANWTMEHYTTKGDSGPLWTLERSHSLRVAKIIAGGGYYTQATGDVGLLVAHVPGVIAAGSGEDAEINSQILVANQTKAQATTEFSQRAGDGFAALQDIPTLRPEIPDILGLHSAPSSSQWHTHTIGEADNIRGLSYDTSTRWLLTELNFTIQIENGRLLSSPAFQEETTDIGYGIVIVEPPPPVFYSKPVLPPLPDLGEFPVAPGLKLPTGAVPADEQPVTGEDVAHAGAKDPARTREEVALEGGDTVVVWSDTQVAVTSNFALSVEPSWDEITPSLSGNTIKEVIWDRFASSGKGGYLVATNDDIDNPDTSVFRNLSMDSLAGWIESTIDDLVCTSVRVMQQGNVIVYGKGGEFIGPTWTIQQLNGNGTAYLSPSSESGSHAPPVSNAPGTYNSGEDRYYGPTGDGGGKSCNVEFDIPPGSTITQIAYQIEFFRGSNANGERNWDISIDGTIIKQGQINGGTVIAATQTETITSIGTPLPLSGSKLVFHFSIERQDGGSFVRINYANISGSSEENHAATRFSEDFDTAEGEFQAAKGIGLMDLGDGSFDGRFNQSIFASENEQIRWTLLAGNSYGDESNGTIEAGQYGKAIRHFGRSNRNYLVAPDGGTIGLFKAIEGVGQTDITPNDGSSDGFVVSQGGLAITNVDEDYIWFLGSFGGSIKLGRSTDLGATWNFATDPGASANWVDVNPRNNFQVYIANGSNILYSQDGGATFVTKTAPFSGLKGIAIL
jgi:hypothetical protein